MFIYDKPIESEKDDFLGRKKFSQHLGKSLLDWKEKESLVVAIYGEWGVGKSSVINLAIENIKEIKQNNKPTIIEFNPWNFSEDGNLTKHFFNEIAKELKIKNDTEKDEKIAKKLKFYSSLLNLAPEKNILSSISSKALLILSLLGITSSQIINWFNVPSYWIKNILLIIGIILLLIELLKDYLKNFANYFEKKVEYYSKSVSEVKNDIKEELIKRQKKLIIVIDDIDRLNQSEIRQIFRLIRVNADFPNTIYLLAFDRNIVEKNLEEQVGISGKDYLNKIVQVNFDIPFAKPSKIYTFLFKELNRILSILPESAQKYFDQDAPYWVNIFHSGFKEFFRNIRDVKKFVNSLEFNISQMYQGNVMEVNPIDFIAIEAIRVFAPDFYSFMRNKGPLFTSTDGDDSSSSNNNPRKDEIEKALNLLPDETKKPVCELIRRLFPQIDSIFERVYSSYGNAWQSNWSKDLRVCASKNFDSYFTLIPGGDEEELSQFEIEDILNKTNSEKEFEKILRQYISKGKIREVLQRIQDFTNDQTRIPQDNVINVVKALFNISDDLPEESVGMLDFGADIDLMRIIYQLMSRETNKAKNFELLKEAIQDSKGLYGPVKKVSLESSRKEKNNASDNFLIPDDKIEELQESCVKKIESNSTDILLNHKNLLYILYRWKEWGKNENKWNEFINEVSSNDIKLLLFVTKFILKIKSQTIGDYGIKTNKQFNYKSLRDFIDISEVKRKLEKIKTSNGELYNDNKETIDLFLDNYDKRDKEFY